MPMGSCGPKSRTRVVLRTLQECLSIDGREDCLEPFTCGLCIANENESVRENGVDLAAVYP